MKKHYRQVITIVAIGNALFAFWVLYNGINEGFNAPPVAKVSYISLIVLLILNSVLLFMYQKKG